MSKQLGKVRGKTRNLLGVRSSVKQGQFAGDGIFHDTVDSLHDEMYEDYSQYVVLSTDQMKSEDIAKLSGEVKTYHISELEDKK